MYMYLEVLWHNGSVGLSDEPGGWGGAAVTLRVDGVSAEGVGTGTETFHVMGRVGVRGGPGEEEGRVQGVGGASVCI